MASLKFSVSLESKNPNFAIGSSQLLGQCSISAFTGGYVHITGVYLINTFSNLNRIRVSRADTAVSDDSGSNEVDSSFDCSTKEMGIAGLVLGKGLGFGRKFSKGRRNVWQRVRGVKRVRKDVYFKSTCGGNGSDYSKEQQSKPIVVDEQSISGVDVDKVGALSTERCNSILKNLERTNDDSKALKFFEWMRRKGKLKQNVAAYNLALRVVGRARDWDLAEKMILEMTSESGCELNFQVFNTLIYACSKQRRVGLGAKWFRMMLENGVRPNEATFGMLMSLCQKSRNVEEGEFTFSHMRNFGVRCQSAYSSMLTIYTRLDLYDKAEKVISFLREDEVVLNRENWLVLINTYCQQGKLEEAELVLVSMQEAGFSPNIVVYNMLITGYGKVSKMEDAHRLFHNLRAIQIEPDETTYRSMIEGWGRANNYKEAQWYYKELKREGFRPNSSNMYTMINLQARNGDEGGALTTLEDMITMGCQYSSMLGILLQAYERYERFDKVPQVLEGSFYEHVLCDQTSCSILAEAYVKHSLVDDAVKILQNKKWKDRGFEDNLYHLLICSCKDMGHFKNAIKIYTNMPKSDEKINLHIICTMIDIYSVMKRFTEAENIYLNLKSSGIALDLITFSVVVRMYIKAGNLKGACLVLETIDKQKNIVPDIYLICDMLRVYQKCGMLDNLRDLYYKLLRSEITWDQEMYKMVINCCARALPIDELSRLFDEMLDRGFDPDTVTFNIVLHVYGRSKLFKKARKVLWMARKRGMVDVISYNTLIAVYGQHKYLGNMASIAKKMQFDGFSVSLHAYNSMLDAYGKEGEMEKFRSVLQRLRESGAAADHYTYNIMINIYGEQGWIEEVAEVLMELKESGIGLDLCSYNTLIKAYGIAGMVEDALGLLKGMRKNGIEPDTRTYRNVLTALQRNDMFFEAVKWSLWMKQMGLSPNVCG
ncbi:pentatricopeptide repeat-containing protein At4g30825, chloroplastic-like [Rhododendron vialii]|uniref:pentatricopeptide repeat-containing protein At4g30825, chloroplastic-like n=1 Tax=Rhododendron vialii TaxID=182163 RepID=UPI00265FABAE|nr:pentatricopeptide repeat-containing protein At4g30825, chloroplastic-like [Rhododendron vialii]